MTKRQRQRKKAEALLLLMGRPPSRRLTGRMIRVLWGGRR